MEYFQCTRLVAFVGEVKIVKLAAVLEFWNNLGGLGTE
jgi:hypothetical protein